MTFEVLNAHTGKPFTDDEKIKIAQEHKLIYCDINQFFIGEDGQVILTDDCGNFAFMHPDDVIVKPLKKKTNLDRIFEMTSDELANIKRCDACAFSSNDPCAAKCRKGLRQWLDQEVDE